jgi:hypothetical protein
LGEAQGLVQCFYSKLGAVKVNEADLRVSDLEIRAWFSGFTDAKILLNREVLFILQIFRFLDSSRTEKRCQ